jgi:sugar/nucleoside kinase (ribokinase family)
VIVVIGSPAGRQTEHGIEAGGMAATVARVAAAAGADVQLVGKVGEGAAGDAVLLSLAQARVGHVAVLRDASRETPITASAPDADAVLDPIEVTGEADGDEASAVAVAVAQEAAGSSLDSGDLELALQYLPDYRVVVVTETLGEPALATVSAAARWAGAQLIVVVPSGTSGRGMPDDATVLESPPADPDGAFAAVIGAYATALDRGASPAEAFASASVGTGWAAVVD